MKKIISLAVLLMGLVVIDSLAQVETILEHKVPPGWRYKSFAVSRSDIKALYFLPVLPDEVLLTENHPGRLQVFNEKNNLIADLIIEDNYRLSKISRNDRIILCDGEESGCYHIKVLDPSGKEMYTTKAEGRWPVTAPYGKDIALVPGQEDIGPVSIIDEDTGREKARISPPTGKDKAFRIAAFFPLGEDGLYVQGVGATLCLKSYLHINEVYWKIQDIGGNIKSGVFLNDEYLAIRYGTDDFRDHKFMAGVAIVEWRTGNVVFKKKAFQISGVQDRWFSQLESLSVLVDNGSLYFYGNPNDVLRLPRRSDGRNGWDENRSVKGKFSPGQIGEITLGGKLIKPEIHAGKYVITDFGDAVRIEKSKFVDVR
jgi:hypothetical protein